jgi:hypothetical protein
MPVVIWHRLPPPSLWKPKGGTLADRHPTSEELARLADAFTGDADWHLSYENLAALAAGGVAPEEREAFLQHLEDCLQCRAEYEDLKAFTRARRGRPWARRVLAAAAVAAGVVLGVFTWQGLRTGAPELVVSLGDGGRRIGLDRAGEVHGLNLETASGSIANVLKKGKLPVSPSVVELAGRQEMLLGEETAAAFTVRGPAGTLVASDRPGFAWSPAAGAEGYRVTVYGPRFEQVADSGRLAGTRWTPAAALPRGVTLTWVVVAYTRGGELRAPAAPAPEARFQVAGTAAVAELERARATGSRLAVAVVAARLGLMDEARAAVEALARENPGSALVARLREQVAR